MPQSLALLTESYEALGAALNDVDEPGSWQPTGCLGWSVRDLTAHCWLDAQRALVALHTPTERPADTDAVNYWKRWGAADPGGEGAAAGRRYSRVMASLFTDWSQLRGEYLDTTMAAVCAAGERRPDYVVATQGKTLQVDDLLSTLAIEATIHHLDLVKHLDGVTGPSPQGLAATRRVFDRLAEALARRALSKAWPDERCVLLATGRARPTDAEAKEIAGGRSSLPFFT